MTGVAEVIPHSSIRVMMELASRHPDAINLSVGEPDFPTPPAIIEAAAEAARAGATKYTSAAGTPQLRAAIADKMTAQWQREVTPDQVIVTAGAVASLAAAVLALAGPGDEVLIPDPGWPNCVNMTLLANAVPKRYPLHASRGYQPDLDELDALMTERTVAIMINSPGNPTGAVWPAEMVDAVVDLAARKGVRVISDEVYEAFTFDAPHASAAQRHPDVIYVSGCSKSYAMTGWRIGYAIAPSPLIDVMTRSQEPLVSCPAAISQAAAFAAITGPQESVGEMAAAYARRRDLVVDILEPAGLLRSRPTGAFYALVDFRATRLTGFPLAEAVLTEAGVVTVSGDGFGERGKGFVRISFAASDDLVAQACRRLVDFAVAHTADAAS